MPFDPDGFRTARSVFEIALDLDRIYREVGAFLVAHTSDPKANQIGMVKELLRYSRQANILAYAFVGGIKPEDGRAAQLAEAVAYKEGMLGERFSNLLPLLTEAKLDTAMTFLSDALSRLESLNLDLPHSDPPMEPAKAVGRRTIISEHGDYAEAQKFGHWATHYLYEWVEEWLKLFENTATNRFALGECLGLSSLIMAQQHQAGALTCGVSTYWKWDGLENPVKILAAARLLTRARGAQGTPGNYLALTSLWNSISSNKPAWRKGGDRIADSWSKNDEWVDWMLVEFPNSIRFGLPA